MDVVAALNTVSSVAYYCARVEKGLNFSFAGANRRCDRVRAEREDGGERVCAVVQRI